LNIYLIASASNTFFQLTFKIAFICNEKQKTIIIILVKKYEVFDIIFSKQKNCFVFLVLIKRNKEWNEIVHLPRSDWASSGFHADVITKGTVYGRSKGHPFFPSIVYWVKSLKRKPLRGIIIKLDLINLEAWSLAQKK
jgi:hypothetical protein